MTIRARTLIKRYNLPLVYRQWVTDDLIDDPWGDGGSTTLQFTKLIAEMCTVQSLMEEDYKVLPAGTDLTTTRKIYTNSFIPSPIEGSDNLPAAVYLPNEFFQLNTTFQPKLGGWYKVVAVKSHLNGVVQHFEVVVTRDDQPKPTEYPDTAPIDAEILDRDTFLNGVWETTWLS